MLGWGRNQSRARAWTSARTPQRTLECAGSRHPRTCTDVFPHAARPRRNIAVCVCVLHDATPEGASLVSHIAASGCLSSSAAFSSGSASSRPPTSSSPFCYLEPEFACVWTCSGRPNMRQCNSSATYPFTFRYARRSASNRHTCSPVLPTPSFATCRISAARSTRFKAWMTLSAFSRVRVTWAAVEQTHERRAPSRPPRSATEVFQNYHVLLVIKTRAPLQIGLLAKCGICTSMSPRADDCELAGHGRRTGIRPTSLRPRKDIIEADIMSIE